MGNDEKIVRQALLISPIDMRQNNGMAQLQAQLLQGLCSLYNSVDLLSLGARPAAASRWLCTMGSRQMCLKVHLLSLHPLTALYGMAAELFYAISYTGLTAFIFLCVLRCHVLGWNAIPLLSPFIHGHIVFLNSIVLAARWL